MDARTATDPETVLGLFVDDVEEIVQNGISQTDCCFGVTILDVSVRGKRLEDTAVDFIKLSLGLILGLETS